MAFALYVNRSLDYFCRLFDKSIRKFEEMFSNEITFIEYFRKVLMLFVF